MNDRDSKPASNAWLAPLAGFLLIGLVAALWWSLRTPASHGTSSNRAVAVSLPAAASNTVVNQPSATVYEGDFYQDAGDEWSQKNVWTANNSLDVAFLGPIKEKPLFFTTANLPPHKFVRVIFKLLTYQPWNGDSIAFGRDLWDMRVVNGQPLIHTTFSDCGYFNNNNEQSFPDQYPWYPTHPGWTGAATFQTLGYKSTYATSNGITNGHETHGTDSTYAFDLTFPHSADTLKLQFKSLTKGHQVKPYGFLSFKVETVDRAAPADENTLARWWIDLADEDPVIAYHAVWSLIATGDTATHYIKANLPPMPATADAQDTLPLNIDQTQPWKYACFTLATPAARQQARAIHVLEVINSTDSLSMLKAMGYHATPEGAPPDHFTPRPPPLEPVTLPPDP